jgi:hypothetical protein
MTDQTGAGPDPAAITAHITSAYDGVDVVEAYDAIFFSVDPVKHWPNFATIVTTDIHDQGSGHSSDLSRPGVFRLNIGVGKETFERLTAGQTDPDYTALDTVIPHPVYAKQRWVAILNPSAATFESQVKPLLDEAYGRVTRQAQRR